MLRQQGTSLDALAETYEIRMFDSIMPRQQRVNNT